MVTPSQALQTLSDDFFKMRQDSLDLSIAAKESEMAQDLAIRASKKLSDDFENSQPGQFNADEQVKWYDSEVEKLTSGITNQDQRTKFKNLLNRNRGSFAIDAEGKALQSYQEQETLSLKSVDDAFYMGLTDPNRDPVNDVLVGALTSYGHYKQAGTRTTRKTLDTREDNAILAALNTKSERLKNAFAKGDIKRDQYVAGIESLEAPLREAGIFDTLSGDVRNKTLTTLETIKTNAIVGGFEAKANSLVNNYEGEIQRIKMGGTPNFDYIEDVADMHERFPENVQIANLYTDVQIYADNALYFQDRAQGDLKGMNSELQLFKETARQAKTGKELQLKQKALSILESNYAEAFTLFNTNTAEFFKDNSRFKSVKANLLANSDDPEAIAGYVSTLQNLVQEQGGDTTSFEILDENLKAVYRQQLNPENFKNNPRGHEAQVLALRQQWSQVIDKNGTTAGDLIINQLALSENSLDIISRYAGTTSYTPLFIGLNSDIKELKDKSLAKNKDYNKLQSAVIEELGDSLELFASRNAANQQQVDAMIDAATQMALYSVRDRNSGLSGQLETDGDFTKAAQYANKLLFSNHQRIVNKDRVKATASLNEPQIESMLKQINNNPKPFFEKVVLDWAREYNAGNVVLPADVTKMVDMDMLGGEGFRSLDFDEMTGSLTMVDAPNGVDKAFQLEIFDDAVSQKMFIPFRLKDKNGQSHLVTVPKEDVTRLGLEIYRPATKQSRPTGSQEPTGLSGASIEFFESGTFQRLATTAQVGVGQTMNQGKGILFGEGDLSDRLAKILFPDLNEPVQGLNEFDRNTEDLKVEADIVANEAKVLLFDQKQLELELEFTPRKAGNLRLTDMPQVKNKDGSISTIRTIGIEWNGLQYIIPTVVNGEVVSDEKAIKHFKKTKKHLGAFDSVEEANQFAEALHLLEQERIK